MIKIKGWDLLRSVGGAMLALSLMFAALLAGVTPVSAASRGVVTGTETIPAGELLVILAPEPGKIFSGHITTGGSATSPNDPSKYDIQVTIEGAPVHITGGPTHMPATRDQNAAFIGEILRIHNFSDLVAPPGYDITVNFAVLFERRRPGTP